MLRSNLTLRNPVDPESLWYGDENNAAGAEECAPGRNTMFGSWTLMLCNIPNADSKSTTNSPPLIVWFEFEAVFGSCDEDTFWYLKSFFDLFEFVLNRFWLWIWLLILGFEWLSILWDGWVCCSLLETLEDDKECNNGTELVKDDSEGCFKMSTIAETKKINSCYKDVLSWNLVFQWLHDGIIHHISYKDKPRNEV